MLDTALHNEKGASMKKIQPTYNREMQKVFLRAVGIQLRDNKPPETKKTYERLIAEGMSERDAKLLIASAIAFESFNIVKTGAPFNKERFVRHLNMLPDQSFIDE